MGTQKSTGYVAVNGTRLYHEQRGAGPALVFIPGGTVESTHFAAVAELLAGEFRTVTYDRRGNGRSPRGAGRHATSITEQADDVAGLVEALGLGPCAVWGGSLGGVVLLRLLDRRPGLVGAAVVHEPPLFDVLDDGASVASGLSRAAAQAVRRARLAEAFANHVREVLGDAFDRMAPELRRRMSANAATFFDLEVPALVTTAPDRAQLAATLARTDIPMAFLADPATPDSPPSRAAAWLASQVDTEVRALPGGHMPYVTEPELTAQAIRAVATLEATR